jgi:dethiobiotin synthetase
MTRILFITGTDTGVGKTVLTALLARHLRSRGLPIAALKPISSGSRSDARALHRALDGELTLDEINPWHFRAALAPLLSARYERRVVRKAQVIAHVRRVATRFPLVLVEGAGGLLSPLGEKFDSRDLIAALRAEPLVVTPNRLGAVNQVRLILAALPAATARRTQVILVNPRHPDPASPGNAALLAEFVEPGRIHLFPWLRPEALDGSRPLSAAARMVLERIAKGRLRMASVH